MNEYVELFGRKILRIRYLVENTPVTPHSRKYPCQSFFPWRKLRCTMIVPATVQASSFGDTFCPFICLDSPPSCAEIHWCLSYIFCHCPCRCISWILWGGGGSVGEGESFCRSGWLGGCLSHTVSELCVQLRVYSNYCHHILRQVALLEGILYVSRRSHF